MPWTKINVARDIVTLCLGDLAQYLRGLHGAVIDLERQHSRLVFGVELVPRRCDDEHHRTILFDGVGLNEIPDLHRHQIAELTVAYELPDHAVLELLLLARHGFAHR